MIRDTLVKNLVILTMIFLLTVSIASGFDTNIKQQKEINSNKVNENLKNPIEKSSTIIVPDDYPTIQEAVDAADTGDTVFVRAGIYYENVEIDKAIGLIGEDNENTIIDGGLNSHCVRINCDLVTVTNFKIQNCGTNFPSSGIYSRDVNFITINDNNVYKCRYGIYLFIHCV